MLPIVSAARKHPNALAFDDGDSQLTYGEIAAALSRSKATHADLQAGDHIAWCPANDFDAYLDLWAILSRRCVACPISHRFPEVTRREIIRRIDAKWLPELPARDSRPHRELDDHDPYDPNAPATLILSSGSTGQPKAIVHPLTAHIASAVGAAENIPLGRADRWLWSLPLCHISGLSILMRCAVAAATVVGMPTKTKLSASMLHSQSITHLSVVSTQLHRLMEDERFPSPHLKAVLLGGSSVDPALVTAARKRGVPVHTTYGLTEMASQVLTSNISGDPAKSGSLLPGREMKVCPTTGEIKVRGPMLCLGYYRSGTIEQVADESGWFDTKDLGELDAAGQLLVKGRIDNMFISGGENTHPETIERAMLSLFDIANVVVVPKPDATFGARPVAFVKGELPPDWAARLREKLQGFEIPVRVYAWPIEADGTIKPDRIRLRMLAEEASQEPSE